MNTESSQSIRTGVQFAGEALLPGGSNIVNGNFLKGGIYAVVGLAAKAMFGLPGLLIVSANSFSDAVTGHNIFETLREEPRTHSKDSKS